jgi:hypothetical protein
VKYYAKDGADMAEFRKPGFQSNDVHPLLGYQRRLKKHLLCIPSQSMTEESRKVVGNEDGVEQPDWTFNLSVRSQFPQPRG